MNEDKLHCIKEPFFFLELHFEHLSTSQTVQYLQIVRTVGFLQCRNRQVFFKVKTAIECFHVTYNSHNGLICYHLLSDKSSK